MEMSWWKPIEYIQNKNQCLQFTVFYVTLENLLNLEAMKIGLTISNKMWQLLINCSSPCLGTYWSFKDIK
jgi:hypothetical protein